MKTIINLLLLFSGFMMNAQEIELKEPRLSLSFWNNNQTGATVKVKCRERVGRRYQNIEKLMVSLYNLSDDSKIGEAISDIDGIAEFPVPKEVLSNIDSTGLITIEARVENQEGFSDSSEELEFAIASLELNFEESEENGILTATIKNTFSGEFLEEEGLKFYVKSYFRPLTIGKDFNMTDENGQASVEISNEIVANKDGEIIVGVILEDSDLYGTVSSEKIIKFGKPNEYVSTFNDRSLWGSRDKTPLWLLIFPNLIIITVWLTLIFLVYKLYVISKSTKE